jgi:hypothetical protein
MNFRNSDGPNRGNAAVLDLDKVRKTSQQLGCLLFTLLSWITLAPAAVLDQSQDTTNSNILIGPDDQRIAQTFTPGIDGKLEKVRLRIGYLPAVSGDAGDLLLEVMNTDNDLPNGTVLGSASLAHGAFPLAGGLFNSPYTDFDFPGVPLHAGTRYALALRVLGGDTCGAGSASCTTPAYRADDVFGVDPYPIGQLFLGANVLPTFALSGDLSFQTYMTAAAVPEPAGWLALIAGFAALAAARRLRTANRRGEPAA